MLRFSLLAAVLFILAGTASADRKQNDMRCHAMTIKTEIVTVMGRPCIEEADSTEEQEQKSSPREELVFYYHTDHLGSTNIVTGRGPTLCHATEYLPYGEEFVDLMASGSDPELPFKFNGKELDSETGLLYYGARYYMPKYYQWPTCDPMELKYPGVSSYSFCKNNPMNRIDLYGKDSYYTMDGQFIETDSKSTDNIYIRTAVYSRPFYNQYTGWSTSSYSIDVPLPKIDLRAEAYSNIFTDILSKINGVDVNDLHNSRVSIQKIEYDNNPYENIPYYFGDGYNDAPHVSNAVASIGKHNRNSKQMLTAYIFPIGSEERNLYSSVSNIENLLGVHEYFGHFKNKMKNHKDVFNLQKTHPSWIKTTNDFKKYENTIYNKE